MSGKSRWLIFKLVFNLSFVIGGMWFMTSDSGLWWVDLMKVLGAIGMVNTVTWFTLRQEPS